MWYGCDIRNCHGNGESWDLDVFIAQDLGICVRFILTPPRFEAKLQGLFINLITVCRWDYEGIRFSAIGSWD